MKYRAAILTAMLAIMAACGSPIAPTPDVVMKFWAEGADFHRCGLDYITVSVDGVEIGVLRDQGPGASWRVRVETYVSHGRHEYYAIGHRPYAATNTMIWRGEPLTNPTFGATIHLCCGSGCAG